MRPINISGSQAEEYYYAKDPFFGKGVNSEWAGKLAEEFGLSGQVKEEHFLNIIAGNNLSGAQIIQDGTNKKGQKEHRAAIDIPLAAPKSVSIMALHVEDKKILDSHKEAIADTIQYIEQNYVYARKTFRGVTRAFKTGNGIFATFDHSTSRANDPHLHTHTLCMNMSRTPDGYRAVFNDKIFQDQTLLNSVYQGFLSKHIREKGFGIEYKENGLWEIAGVKEDWIKTFSKRTGEIDKAEAALKDQEAFPNAVDATVRDLAQRSSRDKKDVKVSKEDLLDIWQKQVPREKIAHRVVKHMGMQNRSKLSQSDYIKTAYEAINETESTFKSKTVIHVALQLSRGHYSVYEIQSSFNQAVKDGHIVRLATVTNSKGLDTEIYTSREMQRIEQNILNTFNRCQNDVDFKIDPRRLKGFMKSNYDFLNTGQSRAVDHILKSHNRFSIIQGDAGTGKTTALQAVKKFVDRENLKIDIVGLGYTGKAAKEIEDASGIRSRTLHNFLSRANVKPSNPDERQNKTQYEGKVFFHGTDGTFDRFEKTNDIGFHFGSYYQAVSRMKEKQHEHGSRVIQASLSIKNPLRVKDTKWGIINEFSDTLVESISQKINNLYRNYNEFEEKWSPGIDGRKVEAEIKKLSNLREKITRIYDSKLSYEQYYIELRNELKANGFDGLVYANKVEGSVYKDRDSYVVFDAEQIQTLDSHYNPKNSLHRVEKSPSEKPQLWIVDESSMVGSRQMHHLMNKAVKQNARVVFIGDGKQLQAIAAGKMFKELQQHGRAEVIILDEVLRQKTLDMKRLVGHISNYHSGRDTAGIDKAFEVLIEQQAITFSGKTSKRIGAAVEFYLSSDNRDKSLIVTPLNDDRIEINHQIRSAIKAERNIKREVETTVKIPVSMVGTKPYFARNYKKGQDVFVTSSTLSELKTGSEATIVATDERLNTITLNTGNGKNVTVDLQAGAADFSVYSKEQRKFFKGDRLVFLKNDKLLEVQNSLTGKVEQIGVSGVFTVKVDGKDQRIKFHKDKFQYFDHGYAVTVHKSQGQTSKSVAFVTDQKSPLNKFESFYTAMTRAEDKAVLICDNPNEVKQQFKQEQGKTSVIEFAKQQISFNRELSR